MVSTHPPHSHSFPLNPAIQIPQYLSSQSLYLSSYQSEILLFRLHHVHQTYYFLPNLQIQAHHIPHANRLASNLKAL